MRMLMMVVLRLQRVLIDIFHSTNANRKAPEAK